MTLQSKLSQTLIAAFACLSFSCLIAHADPTAEPLYKTTINNVDIVMEAWRWENIAGDLKRLTPKDAKRFTINAENKTETALVLKARILVEQESSPGKWIQQEQNIEKLLYPLSRHCIGPDGFSKFVRVLDIETMPLKNSSLQGSFNPQGLFKQLGKQITVTGTHQSGKISTLIQSKSLDHPIYLIEFNPPPIQVYATEWDGAEIEVCGKLHYYERPQIAEPIAVGISSSYFFFDMSTAKLSRIGGAHDPKVSLEGDLKVVPGSNIVYLENAYKGKPVFLVNFDTLPHKRVMDGVAEGTKIRAEGKLQFWNKDYSQYQPQDKTQAVRPHYYFDISETKLIPLN